MLIYTGVIMNKSLILEKITEKVQTEQYFCKHGETNFNVIYNTLETALFSARYYRNFVNDHDEACWRAFCIICNEKRVYSCVLHHFKKSLMNLIKKK